MPFPPSRRIARRRRGGRAVAGRQAGEEAAADARPAGTGETGRAGQPAGDRQPGAGQGAVGPGRAEAAARTAYESDPAWTAAARELKAAQAAYDDAVPGALKALKARDDYRAAQARLDAAQAKVDSLQTYGTSDAATSSDAAAAAMNARLEVRSLEARAVSLDPAANAAQHRLAVAKAATADLRLKESAAVDADPAVVAAKAAVATAKAGGSPAGGGPGT